MSKRLLLQGCSVKKSKANKIEGGKGKNIEKEEESVEKRLLVGSWLTWDEQIRDHTVWYEIDPARSNTIETIHAFRTVKDSEIDSCFGAVALGSKLYMLGGERGYSGGRSDALCFDIATTTTERMPDMLAKRCAPAAVSTHGKIYVFGSIAGPAPPRPWAELFDPNSRCWSPLPDPPDYVRQLRNTDPTEAALVCGGDKILVYIDTTVSCFDVNTNRWTFLKNSPSINARQFMGMTSTFDGFLFSFKAAHVFVHDLIRGMWLEEPVQGLHIKSLTSETGPPEDGRVVHLGGCTFSAVWYDSLPPQLNCLCCIRFHVTRVNNSCGEAIRFVAEVDCRSTYRLANNESSFMIYCFPM